MCTVLEYDSINDLKPCDFILKIVGIIASRIIGEFRHPESVEIAMKFRGLCSYHDCLTAAHDVHPQGLSFLKVGRDESINFKREIS